MTDTLLQFMATIQKFHDEDVVGAANEVLQESADMAFEAIVIGSAFGPGAPGPLTGFLRSSFRGGLNAPVDGPVAPARTTARRTRRFPAARVPVGKLSRFKIGSMFYITTSAGYAGYLEDLPLIRRSGPSENRGRSTKYIDPVVRNWSAIVADAMRRRRFGEVVARRRG